MHYVGLMNNKRIRICIMNRRRMTIIILSDHQIYVEGCDEVAIYSQTEITLWIEL